MAKELPPDIAERGESAPTHIAPEEQESGDEPLHQYERRLQENATLRRVSVHHLKPNPFQPKHRSHRGVSDLAESLRMQGLIHPPLVRPAEDGGYEIATGHRRVEAWRILVAKRSRKPKMRVFVAELNDEDLLFLALAEGHHREDFTAVEDAEFVDEVRKARAMQLGREPTVRDLADVIPTEHGRTAVAQALVIARALDDHRIEHLVRQADRLGKSLLYNVLRHEEFKTKYAALKVAADGGSAKEVEAVLKPKRAGRSLDTVTRKKRGKAGEDITVRVRANMSREELDEAIEALETTAAELKGRRGDSES